MVRQQETVQACLPSSIDTEGLPETAQHELCKQRVKGSNPFNSTITQLWNPTDYFYNGSPIGETELSPNLLSITIKVHKCRYRVNAKSPGHFTSFPLA